MVIATNQNGCLGLAVKPFAEMSIDFLRKYMLESER